LVLLHAAFRQQFCGKTLFTLLSQSRHDATRNAICKQVKSGLVNKLLGTVFVAGKNLV
jgi:hypothetical protein